MYKIQHRNLMLLTLTSNKCIYHNIITIIFRHRRLIFSKYWSILILTSRSITQRAAKSVNNYWLRDLFQQKQECLNHQLHRRLHTLYLLLNMSRILHPWKKKLSGWDWFVIWTCDDCGRVRPYKMVYVCVLFLTVQIQFDTHKK